MTVDQVMVELQRLGNDQVRRMNTRHGAGENQFGVKMGDLRTVAKRIKSDHALAKSLWKTGNLEARFLSTLICTPREFTPDELDDLVRSLDYSHLAEWLTNYVVRQHPEKEALRLQWMEDKNPGAARVGWNLTAERVDKDAYGLDLTALLDRIEREMGSAPELTQWSMNYCLAQIGISHPAHRSRAVAIGEKLGVYRDYPVSKGCTSPFAPIWIAEMVKRSGG